MNKLLGLLYSPSHGRARRAAALAQYWARWTYAEDEWQRFDRLDWARTRRWYGATLAMIPLVLCWWACIGPFVLETFLVHPGFPSNTIPWIYYPLIGFIFLGAVATIVSFLRTEWKTYVAGKARHEERQAPESTRTLDIGPLGIYQSGNRIPLVGPGLRLTDVYIDRWDSSRLVFQMFRGQNIPTGIGIPIPKGQEASAQELVERFKREVL
jgi:hypothetical protein